MKTIQCDEIAPDHVATTSFEQDMLQGLSQQSKTLPCKYFYDGRGSKLFEQICQLEEYYPTRTESEILADHIQDICQLCGSESLLVELGSGSSTKTRLLLDHLENPVAYVPIDISGSHLMSIAEQLREDYDPLEILPLCTDYNDSVTLPIPSEVPERTVVFFPGSTIGNFEPPRAKEFLKQVASWCEPGDGLLIGVDVRKDKKILERAYNDSRGITAAFNLNLLVRANRELGANFQLNQFRHEAIFDETCGRIEMRLVSRCRQVVQVGSNRISFQSNERITTEYSYKYRIESFRQLACEAGWRPVKTWTDPKRFFSVHFLTAAPNSTPGF